MITAVPTQKTTPPGGHPTASVNTNSLEGTAMSTTDLTTCPAETQTCDSPSCVGKTADHVRLFHLIIAAEFELAERRGHDPLPAECPEGAKPTPESHAMVERILNAPPKTAAELAEQAAFLESTLEMYARHLGGIQ